MTPEQIKAALSWLEGAEAPWTNSEGSTTWKLILPETILEALKEHLRLLLEASDSRGVVFEIKDDRLVFDGVEFVVPPEQFEAHSKTGLLSVVRMRLARMYNITRKWEGD